jgi:hypothetical protein
MRVAVPGTRSIGTRALTADRRCNQSGVGRPGAQSPGLRQGNRTGVFWRARQESHLRVPTQSSDRSRSTDPLTGRRAGCEARRHKEVAITLGRYSHALPTLQTTAMARLDANFGRGDDAAPQPEVTRAPIRAPRRSSMQTKGPIRAWIGPTLANLVPHTGCLLVRPMWPTEVNLSVTDNHGQDGSIAIRVQPAAADRCPNRVG